MAPQHTGIFMGAESSKKVPISTCYGVFGAPSCPLKSCFLSHLVTMCSVNMGLTASLFRTLAVWNQSNSHPLFTESDARYHQLALTKMRRLLYFICGMTIFSVICECIFIST